MTRSRVVPARTPTTGPPARPVVVLFALLLLAVAGLCVYEFLSRSKLVGTAPLAPGFARNLDGLGMTWWTPWVAGLCVVIGLVAVTRAVSPRRRSHLSASAGALWLRPTDVARLCSAAAICVPGVVDAHTRVSRRRVDVTAWVGGAAVDRIRAELTLAATTVLESLDSPPTLRIVAHTGDRP